MVSLAQHLGKQREEIRGGDCCSGTVATTSTTALSSHPSLSRDLETSLSSLSFGDNAHDSTPSHRASVGSGRRSRPARTSTINSRSSTMSPRLALEQDKDSDRATSALPLDQPSRRSLHCSFCLEDSIDFADLQDLEALDLSLHPEQQEHAQESNTNPGNMLGSNFSKPEQDERVTRKRIPPLRQGSVTNFLQQRVDTFSRNMETIGLLITGEHEIDL